MRLERALQTMHATMPNLLFFLFRLYYKMTHMYIAVCHSGHSPVFFRVKNTQAALQLGRIYGPRIPKIHI